MRRPVAIVWSLLAFLPLTLAGCSGSGSSTSVQAPLTSGIEGMARITTSGGANGGVQHDPAPYPAAVVSVQPGGGGPKITRVTADSRGQFTLTLPPGTYLVVPVVSAADSRNGFSGQSQTVTVTAGQYADIVVQYNVNAP